MQGLPQGQLAGGPHGVGVAIPQVPRSHTVAISQAGAGVAWAGRGFCSLPGSALSPQGAGSGAWGGQAGCEYPWFPGSAL